MATRLRDLSTIQRAAIRALSERRAVAYPKCSMSHVGSGNPSFCPGYAELDTSSSLDNVYAFNAQIFVEDKSIIERQRPEDLPLDTDAEAHFFAADRTSVSYQRLLREMRLKLASVR
jgi:hypothetical protein